MKAQITTSPASAISLATSPSAADVLDPVGVGKAEVAVEPVADIVAVEQHRVAAQRRQLLLQPVGDGRFAGAGQSGEPDDCGLLALERGALAGADRFRLAVDVARPAQGEVDHPGAGGLVGEAVDQDKPAGLAVDPVGVERDRLRRSTSCSSRSR